MLDWFESSQLPAIGRSRKRKVLLMDIFSIPIFTSLLNSVFTDSLYSSVFTDSRADSLSKAVAKTFQTENLFVYALS